MKKLLAILACIIIIAIILFMLFGKFGFGKGSGSGEGERGASASQKVDEVDDATDKKDQRDGKTDSEKDTIIVIEVSVVKRDYFYENRRVELDDLMEIINAIEGIVVVEVTDDNAALKPYNKLLDSLNELDIQYTEHIAD